VLSPSLWLESAQALGTEAAEFGQVLRSWGDMLRDREGLRRVGWAALTFLALGIAVVLLWRWWRRRGVVPGAPTRFGKAVAAIGVMLRIALAVPLATLAAVKVLENFQLLPERLSEIAYGLAIAWRSRHAAGRWR